MSTPPRRSRPKRSGGTIDSTAERLDNEPIADEPIVPQTADAPGAGEPADEVSDPEAQLAADGSDASAEAPDREALPGGVERSGVSVLGEAEPGDRNAPPAADGTLAPPSPDAEPGTLRETAEGEAVASQSEAKRPLDEDGTAATDGRVRHGEAQEIDAETVLGNGGPHAAETSPSELNYHETSPHAAHAQGTGFGTLLGAGLVGAALALILGGILQYAGVVPAVREPNTDQLAQQFARIGDVQQLSTDLSTVRASVEQLQSAVSAGGAGGPSGADFAALADRFNNLEGRVNGLANAAPQNGGQPAAPAIDPNALQGVTTAANEARQAAEGAQTQANEARQTAQTASQAAGTASQAAGVAQQAANGAMEAARANGEAIADIRNRIASVEEANRRAAVAIAAAGLKAAVDRGGPFMSELETFATASGASPVVDALRNYAPEGVPTTRELQDDWPGVRTVVLRALRPEDPNAGLGRQIITGLNSLVAVRPSAQAGAGTSTGPEASVARLDAAMNAGNLDAFDRDWQTLPQGAQDAGADFQRRVAARAEVERVVGQALSSAVNSNGTAN